MSSVDAAPQLSLVRQFEPLNMSSPYRGASMEEEIEWRMRRVKTTTTLESGAPETPEEARYDSLCFARACSFVVVSINTTSSWTREGETVKLTRNFF